MIILRPLERFDLLTLRPWRNNRKLRNQTHGFRFPVSDDMEQIWFEKNVLEAPPHKAIFAIQHEDNSLAGLAQLDGIDMVHRNARLGIFIGAETARGKGLGKKALIELIDFGFADLNLVKIYLYVNVSNKNAIGLYEQTGFVTEGTLKDHYFVNNSWEDLLIMSIFQENWRPLQD